MSARTASVKFLQRIRNPHKRQLTLRLTQAVWNTPDCEHFTDVQVKNPLHTSHSDATPHVTVRMRTPEQIARGAGQTVHIYYDPTTEEFQAFKLYSERSDNEKDEPSDANQA
ncbi:hypothetical protein NU195Hw_g8979t1 [Hortaea werneckii]